MKNLQDYSYIDLRIKNLHPLTEMKEELTESIQNKSDISMETITSKLGPGIYIDLSCGGMVMRIWRDSQKYFVSRYYKIYCKK